jgi:hypothetical protein
MTAQHGPIHRDQLIDLGMTRNQVEYAVTTKRFHIVYPEVYVAGNRKLSELGSLSAAVLACGEGAALGVRSAGQVRGIVKGYRGPIEILVPRPDRPKLKGIGARTATFGPYDVGSCHGIPTTTIARTYFDLCKVLEHKHLVRALNEAGKRGLTIRQMERLVEEHKGERGIANLRAMIERKTIYDGFSNGGFEDAFYDWFLTLKDLPKPRRNAHVLLRDGTTRQVDLLFGKNLAFELDHHPHHGADRAQATIDAQRDRDLRDAGYEVTHFTSDEFLDERDRVERDIRRLLARCR